MTVLKFWKSTKNLQSLSFSHNHTIFYLVITVRTVFCKNEATTFKQKPIRRELVQLLVQPILAQMKHTYVLSTLGNFSSYLSVEILSNYWIQFHFLRLHWINNHITTPMILRIPRIAADVQLLNSKLFFIVVTCFSQHHIFRSLPGLHIKFQI